MSVPMREVAWGEALMVRTSRTRGGLKAVQEVIADQVGDVLGSRNTFGKLYLVRDPEQLPARDKYRAWLVVCAIGEEPVDWGLSDSVVPKAIDARALKHFLHDWCARRDSNPQPLDP
jgi:hypothetical protein